MKNGLLRDEGKKIQGKESEWDVGKIETVSNCFARPLK